MAYKQIGKFSLENEGGFICQMYFEYIDDSGNKQRVKGSGDDIDLGETDVEDPGNYKVPDGALVCLYVSVVAGDDNEAKEYFQYAKGSSVTAYYVISGTTLDNKLALIKVQ